MMELRKADGFPSVFLLQRLRTNFLFSIDKQIFDMVQSKSFPQFDREMGGLSVTMWRKDLKRKRECHIAKKKFVEGNYFRISNFVFDFKLRPITFMVYCCLEKCDNPEHGCFPSKATIAEECGIAGSLVDKAIKELRKRGIVRVEHRRTKNQQQSNMHHLNSLGHSTSQITEMYYVKKDTSRLAGVTDGFEL